MKEQLTIQELAAYLPWEVRFDNGRDYEKDYLKGIRSNCYYVPMAQGSRDSDYFRFEKIKLVLYPLSSLTKEIEHKGEKFVPYLFWDDKERINLLSSCATDYSYCEYLEYFIIQKLHEWNFDTFGLLDRGLAVDKTTIL